MTAAACASTPSFLLARPPGSRRMPSASAEERVSSTKATGRPKRAREAPGEAAREPRHLVLAAVRMARKPHHESGGMPFGHEPFDGGEACLVGLLGNGGDGVREPRFGLPHGHSKALFAEVETEQRSGKRPGLLGRRAQACPASSERFMVVTPRAPSAAS